MVLSLILAEGQLLTSKSRIQGIDDGISPEWWDGQLLTSKSRIQSMDDGIQSTHARPALFSGFLMLIVCWNNLYLLGVAFCKKR